MITFILTVVLIFMMYLIMLVATPGSLLIMFMGVVGCSVYMSYYYVSDLMSYLLFMVYVGGLLVLLIYMIMMSSNYYVGGLGLSLFYITNVALLVSVVALYSEYEFNSVLELKVGSGTLSLEFSCLVAMGLMLLYVFMNICNIISVGGRTLSVGKIS